MNDVVILELCVVRERKSCGVPGCQLALRSSKACRLDTRQSAIGKSISIFSSNEIPDLLMLLRSGPIHRLALATVVFVALGTAVSKYGPQVMPLGVADNLSASLYILAVGLICTLVVRLYDICKRS